MPRPKGRTKRNSSSPRGSPPQQPPTILTSERDGHLATVTGDHDTTVRENNSLPIPQGSDASASLRSSPNSSPNRHLSSSGAEPGLDVSDADHHFAGSGQNIDNGNVDDQDTHTPPESGEVPSASTTTPTDKHPSNEGNLSSTPRTENISGSDDSIDNTLTSEETNGTARLRHELSEITHGNPLPPVVQMLLNSGIKHKPSGGSNRNRMSTGGMEQSGWKRSFTPNRQKKRVNVRVAADTAYASSSEQHPNESEHSASSTGRNETATPAKNLKTPPPGSHPVIQEQIHQEVGQLQKMQLLDPTEQLACVLQE